MSSDKPNTMFSIVLSVASTIFSNGSKNHALAVLVDAVKRMLDDSKIMSNVAIRVRFCINIVRYLLERCDSTYYQRIRKN